MNDQRLLSSKMLYLFSFKLGQKHRGNCFPSSCSKEDVQKLVLILGTGSKTKEPTTDGNNRISYIEWDFVKLCKAGEDTKALTTGDKAFM